MNTAVDILTDIKDCKLLRFYKIIGGKILIHLIPDLAAVDCVKCEEELAKYHVLVITYDESTDLRATLCRKHYLELKETENLQIPVELIH